MQSEVTRAIRFQTPGSVAAHGWLRVCACHIGFCLLLILNAALQTAAADCTSAPGGLVSWWPGDGNASDIASTNNGVLQGGATASAPGMVGSAFTFDGTNGFVQIPDSPSLRPTNLTIECWVQFASQDSAGSGGSPAGDQYIVFRQNSRSSDFEGFDLSKTRVSGSNIFRFLVASASAQTVELHSSTVISAGTWYHVAAVRGSNFVQLYVNGALERQAAISFSQDYGNHPLYFGTSGQSSWDHKLKGSLDEVSLYNRALSPADIAAIYAAGSAGKCKGPSISLISPQSTFPGLPTRPIPFVVADALTPAASLTLQGVSSDPNLVPDQNIVFGGSGSNRTVTVTPLLGTTGACTITLTARNSYGATTNRSFPLTVGGLTQINAGLTNLGIGMLAWGDYNNDGRLDLLATGIDADQNVRTYLYRNDSNGVFSRVNTTFPDLGWSSVAAWGDYDNDGQLDLVLSGWNAGMYITQLWHNEGGGFFMLAANLRGLQNASVAWADFNNDGKLDLLLSGITWNQGYLYLNNGDGTFTEVALGPAMGYGAVACFDFDNDGNTDLLMGGRLFRNDGQAHFTDTGIVLPAGMPAVADYNNDGFLDLVIAGSSVYRNQRGTNFTDVHMSFIGDAVAWGDFDNDGQPDFTAAGSDNGYPVHDLFHNAGSDAFTNTTFYLQGMQASSVAWADYDNDGRLDLAAQGLSFYLIPFTGIYHNDGAMPNTPPTAPANLSVSIIGGAAVFHWAAASDSNQPAGLSYNLRVGTTPGGVEVVTPLADPATGYRRIPAIGNAGLRLTSTITNLKAGTYYWSVQAIDHAYAGSAFAPEQTFTLSAPAITTQPQSGAVVLGGATSFTITATGTAPLGYQWYFNGGKLTDGPGISGSTTTDLSLVNVQASQGGGYTVFVTNAFGTASSGVATLTVLLPPTIAFQPTNRTVIAGAPVTFNVLAGGTPPFVYHWRKDGLDLNDDGRILGTATSTLRIASTQTNDAGSYQVAITNAYGGVTSAVAQLTVLVPPTFVVSPTNQTLIAGSSAALVSLAVGTPPLLYRWYHGTTNLVESGRLVGTTSNVLTITTLLASDAGNYSVIASNQAGVVTSAAAVVTVIVAPSIVAQPTNQAAMAGDTITFSVQAAGTAPLSYQWRFNGTNLPGKTASSLGLANVQLSDAGSYSVLVSNTAGTLLSSNALLTVNPAPPCAAPPAGLIGWWKGEGNGLDSAGSNNAYAVVNISFTNGIVGQAFACDPENYPYFTYTGVQIADQPAYALTNSLSIEAWIQPRGDGYFVFWRGDNRPGYDPYVLYMQDNNNIAFIITDANNTSASVSAPLVYNQWWHVAATLDGASGKMSLYTNGTLAAQITTTIRPFGSLIPGDSPGIGIGNVNDGLNRFPFVGDIDEVSLYSRALTAVEIRSIYTAERSGKCTAPTPPVILLQPTNQVASAGDNITFSVLAAGTAPLSYQWRLNGTNLTAATASSLVLANVQLSGAGSYSVLVTNTAGTLLSSNALLTVNPPPPCAAPPVGLVSWWAAEGSALDQAGVNQGTLAGNASYGPGRVGQGFVFDGSGDGVQVGAATNLQLQDFTIEAWVKRGSTSLASHDLGGGLIFAFGSGGYGFGMNDNGTLFLTRVDVDNVTLGTGITDTNFHHLAVTKSGSTVFFYIDGAAYSVPPYNTAFTFSTPAAVGARGDNLRDCFLGTLDEVSVYNRPLAGAEIQAIYNAERSGKCPLPPDVLAQPASQTVPAGLTATFGLQASGTLPLSYQWFLNGAPLTNDARISGATSNLLSISGVTPADGGSYSVLVTNAAGTATSSNAVLSIVPLLITLQPTNVTGIAGSNVTFSAAVAGALPLSYHWQKDGADLSDGLRISGSRSNTLTITAVQTNDAGGYQLVVTNAYGAVTSQLALLTVLVPPTFVVSPSNQVWVAGSSVSLFSLATGTAPLSYQWYLGATPLTDNARLSGTTSNILSISNILTSDAGSYTVVVTNLAGSVTSTAAVVTVVVPPTIAAQPKGWSVPVGMPVTLTANASGTTPLTYQWLLNGTNVPGAGGTALSFAALRPSDFGSYQVVVTNLGGAVTSTVAPLTLGQVAIWGYYSVANNSPIWPAPGLSNVIAVAGGSSYSLALRGDGTLYGWGLNTVATIPTGLYGVAGIAAGPQHALAVRSNGTVVAWGSNSSGQTTVPAGLSNVVAVAAGAYHSAALRADGTVVTWGGSTRTGELAIPPGLINVAAIDANWYQTFAVRTDGTLVGWGGTPAVPVPPYLHGVVAAAPGSSPSDSNLALLTNGTLAAWTLLGPATNLPPGLTNLMAVETTPGTGGQELQGSGTSLALRSNGTVVAWSVVSGVITNLPSGLSNVVALSGGATHALALENDGSPLIIHPPVGGTFYSGADLVLKAKAIGTASLSFQWFKDGNPVPDATNQTLVVPSAQLTDAGNYQLVVTNALGAAQSLAVPVTIMDRTPLFLWPPFGTPGPVSVMAFYGSPWSVGASVVGSGPMQLTWLKDGVPVATGTNQLYYDRALPQHGGAYKLVASNSFASVTSAVTQVIFSRVASWGSGPNPTNAPFDLGSVLGVASGYFHALAIQSNRTVVGWGATTYGATTPPPGLSNVVAVAAGSYFSVALKSDGTVAAWGLGSSGQTNVPASLTNAVAISAGGAHTLALRADSTVAAWGYNSYGQVAVPAGLSNVVAVAAASTFSMALKNDGTVVLWGASGKPPAFTNAVAVAGGYNQGLVLQADGTVVNWFTSSGTLALPRGMTNIVAITSGGGNQGYLHNVALRADGTLAAWGNNYYGQLMIPEDLLSATTLSAGGSSTLALLNDRSPAIAVQPWSRSVASGTNVALRALIVGAPPVRYQWYCNGQALLGATSNVLVFASAQPAQNGAYQLVAMNAYGAATSAVATLTVAVPPARLTAMGGSPSGFRFSFISLPAVLYIVEFKPTLTAGAWTELERRFGVGGLEIVTDTTATGATRFYRVRALYAPQPSLGSMSWRSGVVSFPFATVSGAAYVVQYKQHLDDTNWLELSRQTGTGLPIVITDPSPAADSRFYRVRVE